MKPIIPPRLIALIVLVGVLLVVLVVNIITSLFFNSGVVSIPPTLQKTAYTPTPTRPAHCVPLPYTVRNSFTRTPTPDLSLGTAAPLDDFSPTVTPIAYTNIYDLDPDLSQEDKSSVIIFRCNGSWDFYWIAPNRDYTQSVLLAEGDFIWMVNPPTSIMGKEPPRITITIITPKQ